MTEHQLSMKDIYDQEFINCIRDGSIDHESDNYNNPLVLGRIKESGSQFLNTYYIRELDQQIARIRLVKQLCEVLVSAPVSPVLWSYILYTKMSKTGNTKITMKLEQLYSHLEGNVDKNVVLSLVNDLFDLYTEKVQPNVSLGDFFGRLVRLHEA